jgi:tripartite-type tricarboxylate transporter receptor subunit TctC
MTTLARTFSIAVASAALIGAAEPAIAQTQQGQPLRLVVGYAPGGTGDVVARILSDRLGSELGQNVVVENRPGATGAIGARSVINSAPDGHTLFVGQTGEVAINQHFMKDAGYDADKDFRPVALAGLVPLALVVPASAPYSTMADFYQALPTATLTFASAGAGTPGYFAGEMLKAKTHADLTHVPYKGNAPAMSDVVAGHVPAIFTNLSDALPQAAAGSIRLIGVSSETRAPQIPDVPTVAEQGFPTFKTRTWNALMAPAKTDPVIISRVAGEVAAAAKDPKFAERLDHLGVDPLGNTPAEFAALIAADIPFWAEAVRIAGVKDQ